MTAMAKSKAPDPEDGVDLAAFIERSLLDILDGLRHAADDEQVGHCIAPALKTDAKIDPAYGVAFHDGAMYTTAQFDIAVTAQKTTGKDGKIRLSIPVFATGLSGGGRNERTSETVSRVKFSVHLRLDVRSDAP